LSSRDAPSARAAAERLFGPTPEQQGEPTRGILKWFEPTKGYGFVRVTGGDVFIHGSVLEGRFDARDLLPGVTLTIITRAAQKGPEVADILDIDVTTAAQPRLAPYATGSCRVAKWNDECGFGFVDFDGGGGCYFNSKCLQRSGIDDAVSVGDRFEVDIADGERGPMAVKIRVLSSTFYTRVCRRA
jgi:CspA family cold shock protein